MNLIPETLLLLQIILIDISLSGDNAVVIAMAAAGLEKDKRGKVILFGTIAAILLRVLFSFIVVSLLNFPALIFVGGLMLLFVSWNMFQEIRQSEDDEKQSSLPVKWMIAAVGQIIIADVSMSLDNVLAVAGAANGHTIIMGFGLVLSIGIMAFAANVIVGILDRWPLLKYAGLALIIYVSGDMLFKSFPYVFEFARKVAL